MGRGKDRGVGGKALLVEVEEWNLLQIRCVAATGGVLVH